MTTSSPEQLPEEHRRPTRRVVLRYAALNLPGLVLLGMGFWWLQQAYSLSSWFVILPLVLWLAKDVVLFPWLWRAFDDRPSARHGPPLGREGVMRSAELARLGNELWRAEPRPGTGPLAAGMRVRVCEARGLSLIVEPLE